MKSIIFTHLKPDIFQYKAGFVLKEKDIKTISISLLKVDREFFKDAFDEIISLDLDNMKPITLLKSFVKHPIKLLKFFYNVIISFKMPNSLLIVWKNMLEIFLSLRNLHKLRFLMTVRIGKQF